MPTTLAFLLLLGLLALAAALYFVWKIASDRRKRAAAVPSRRSGDRAGPVGMTEYGTHPLDLD